MNDYIERKLLELSKSKFRSSFHLNKKMKDYVSSKGIKKIESDCIDLISKRLKDANPKNDGKQTPMRQVHPVFIAEHACACCCRSCLEKWHGIKKGKELNDREITYIISLLIRWIKQECEIE